MKDLAQHLRNLFDIQLTEAQLKAFERYESELLAWNERINLTAIRDPGQVRVKHFLDSLTCLTILREASIGRVIDVGTGAGFPGLPLKIACPEMQLCLVESVGKKADFCRHMVRTLGLQGVEVVQERAEVIGQAPGRRESYDWAVARAVAEMPVLVEYLLPLVRVGGTALAMKGEGAPAETHAADHAIHLLGGRLRRLVSLTLPGVAEQRYLVVIDKIAATPPAYPRRTGLPAKRPVRVKA
jgi:16S rRNA (guanine527-N7)-methyltransferase